MNTLPCVFLSLLKYKFDIYIDSTRAAAAAFAKSTLFSSLSHNIVASKTTLVMFILSIMLLSVVRISFKKQRNLEDLLFHTVRAVPGSN